MCICIEFTATLNFEEGEKITYPDVSVIGKIKLMYIYMTTVAGELLKSGWRAEISNSFGD